MEKEPVQLFDGYRIVGETLVPLEDFEVTPGLMVRLTKPTQIKVKRKPRGNRLWIMVAGTVVPYPVVITTDFLKGDTVTIGELVTGLGLAPRGR
jgi:hypothetical protein